VFFKHHFSNCCSSVSLQISYDEVDEPQEQKSWLHGKFVCGCLPGFQRSFKIIEGMLGAFVV
ncbi:MAG TPA: hypothetical protein VF350_08000, partial [Candidatus Bathyarchaeia archaeon]